MKVYKLIGTRKMTFLHIPMLTSDFRIQLK